MTNYAQLQGDVMTAKKKPAVGDRDQMLRELGKAEVAKQKLPCEAEACIENGTAEGHYAHPAEGWVQVGEHFEVYDSEGEMERYPSAKDALRAAMGAGVDVYLHADDCTGDVLDTKCPCDPLRIPALSVRDRARF